MSSAAQLFLRLLLMDGSFICGPPNSLMFCRVHHIKACRQKEIEHWLVLSKTFKTPQNPVCVHPGIIMHAAVKHTYRDHVCACSMKWRVNPVTVSLHNRSRVELLFFHTCSRTLRRRAYLLAVHSVGTFS